MTSTQINCYSSIDDGLPPASQATIEGELLQIYGWRTDIRCEVETLKPNGEVHTPNKPLKRGSDPWVALMRTCSWLTNPNIGYEG
jgi:hypothetical protein